MIRNIFIFLGTFVGGALIALVVRAAMFAPHQGHEGHPAPGGDYAGMVSNPLTPAKTAAAKPDTAASAPAAKAASVDPHANHGAAAVVAADQKPVNTVCAICGMDVDPKLPTLEYQGKKIGFGCKACPSKFKANPDRYGPFYLRNEIIKQ
jgi:hypothetical protein